jgi:hypothetical protein
MTIVVIAKGEFSGAKNFAKWWIPSYPKSTLERDPTRENVLLPSGIDTDLEVVANKAFISSSISYSSSKRKAMHSCGSWGWAAEP